MNKVTAGVLLSLTGMILMHWHLTGPGLILFVIGIVLMSWKNRRK